MTSNTTCTRFAPSPTGFLHIGGARTALFNYLFARAQGGKFLLRIEDTDKERSEPRFTEDILESLNWLGLTADEEPVYQSNRAERHQALIEQLLQEGKAYKCDATPEALEKYREECLAAKKPYQYPGWSREKPQDQIKEPYVVRIKNPKEGETTFSDLIRGDITVANKDVEDWVISRSNGLPTYNFVVTVDDHDLGISHVLRGEDHINNTPKQVLLYKMLGWQYPLFAHVPMILGTDKSKLSKRHGAASTLEYRSQGYLPEAMINFLVRMGWGHGDQEIFSQKELETLFDMKDIGKSNAMFDVDKLDHWNNHYLKERSAESLLSYLKQYFAKEISFTEASEEATVLQGLSLLKERVSTLVELIEQLNTLIGKDPEYDVTKVKDKHKKFMPDMLKEFIPVLEEASFTREELEPYVRSQIERREIGFGKVGQSIRYAMSAGKPSPDLFEMLLLQGKERVLRRMNCALKAFETSS